MRILIASDIHGSAKYAGEVLGRAKIDRAEEIILLGDVYNHGPRNPLPENYDPMKVAEMLNCLNNLTVIKGNCDSEVDKMISDFTFTDSMVILSDGKRIFLTHGHVYNKDNMPKNIDVLIYGHVHYGFIEEKDGVIVANCGSVSLPKNGAEKSYILIDGDTIYLKNLDGDLICERKI